MAQGNRGGRRGTAHRRRSKPTPPRVEGGGPGEEFAQARLNKKAARKVGAQLAAYPVQGEPTPVVGCSRCLDGHPIHMLFAVPGLETEGTFCHRCWALLTSAWGAQAARAKKLDSHYRYIYGITLERYGEMFVRQAGKCAICRRPQEEVGSHGLLVVDHDHTTGAIRGLLCPPCNMGLGQFGDDLTTLTRAVVYLSGGTK